MTRPVKLLESRLEFEMLITDTSASLVAAWPDELEPAVERALERIRIFFEADRCGLVSVSADRQVVNVRLASYSEGTPPLSPEVNLVPLFPWTWHKAIVEKLPVPLSRITDLPPEADVERKAWNDLRFQSVLTLPIEIGGIVSHLIVLNTVHQECEWPEAIVMRLRVLGEMLVGALDRRAIFTELREAEDRVNMAADCAEAGIWHLDYRTGVFWATERGRKIFGYEPDEVITMESFEASVHPDDWDEVRRVIDRSKDERDPFDVEYRIAAADGSIRWIFSRGQCFVTPLGKPERLMGVSIDISERKRSEEASRQSEARLRFGADLAKLAFYEIDFRACTVFLDDRMRELGGIPPDRHNGLQPVEFWDEHVHPDDLPPYLDASARLFEGPLERVSLEYRYFHPVRGEIWIHHLAGASKRDAGGRVILISGVMREITTRKQAEENLRQSYAEIVRLKDRLQAEGEYLKAEMRLTQEQGPIIGQSVVLRKALRMVEQVAPMESTVLLRGETGTGKELIAQAIHQLSPRRNNLMVKVNCAALPSGLVESELFGREKGAYTGAMTRQLGRFEIADGSTLFLDEVGELPLELQAKLLRVLESGEFERLGSSRTMKVNVRVIAATNRDLAEATKNGKFREDLYYRINVFPIHVPPLRERAEDIPLLVWAFLREFCTRMGKKITEVPKKTMDALQQHAWPGNVRQLRNVLEHGAIITTGNVLRIPPLDAPSDVGAPGQTLADFEREHILRVLKKRNWHIKGPAGAAAELGLNPATLYGRMRKLGIQSRTRTENGSE